MANLVTHVRPSVQSKPSSRLDQRSHHSSNLRAEPAKPNDSGAEERTFGIKRKKSEFEQRFEEEYSDSQRKLRRKKVKEIQNIQSLLLPHQKSQDLANLLSGNSGSKAGLNEVYASSLKEGRSPVLILAALEATEQNSALSEEQKKNVSEFKDRFVDQHSTEILSWNASVKSVREQIKAPELADSVLQLIGRSNHRQPSYLQTFVDILEVSGKENFKSVTNAYINALNEDTKKSVASTNHHYLSLMLGKVSDFSKASSMFSQAEETASKLIGKFDDVEKHGMDFFSAALEIMGDPNDKNIDQVATGFMGLGGNRKQRFKNHVADFLKNIPIGIWNNDAHKINTLEILSRYSLNGNRGNISIENNARKKWDALI